MRDKYLYFWESHWVFSNWHSAKLSIDGILFQNSEQAFMYLKAKLFGDTLSMLTIASKSDPRTAKKLGRLVKGFDITIWDKNKFDLMYQVNMAKFTQNPKMLELLMRTRGVELVEASPFDIVWGIGLNADDAKQMDSSKWPGENLLGKVLDKVRDDIHTKLSEGIIKDIDDAMEGVNGPSAKINRIDYKKQTVLVELPIHIVNEDDYFGICSY